MHRFLPCLFFALALGLSIAGAGEAKLQKRTVYAFPADGVHISNRFPGARVSGCERLGTNEYRILIQPENRPVNSSPWYAFEIWSREARQVRIRLTYPGVRHRYQPRVKRPDSDWKPLVADRVQRSRHGTEATLTLDVDATPTRIAGQELLDNAHFDRWLAGLAKTETESQSVTRRTVGESRAKRPLDALVFGNPDRTNCVAIIGRQHPPEVTGTLGLQTFVERLLADDETARRFRRRFSVIVIPCLNPDGVHEGHWRHNLAGVDLNRDWREFAQPETRAARDAIQSFPRADDGRLLLFLDFHSTYRDVFYTVTREQRTVPENFTERWLNGLQRRFPDYRVNIDANRSTRAVSKAWAWRTFGCPSVTYEFGDHTDRGLIARVTAGSAEVMMRELLESAPDAGE